MLAASNDSPKSRPKPSPKPSNWYGVGEGLQLAKKAFHANDLALAEDILNEILELAPNEAKAWAWCGRIQQLRGHHSTAVQYFKKAENLLQKKPHDTNETPSSLPLAHLLWQQGEEHSARSMLSLLLAKEPNNTDLLQLSNTWGITL